MSKEDGVAKLNLEGETYTLKFNMLAWEIFEDRTGLWFTDLVHSMDEGRFSAKIINNAIYCGQLWKEQDPYNPQSIDPQQASEIADKALESGMEFDELMMKVSKALMTAIPEAREEFEQAFDSDEADIKNNPT